MSTGADTDGEARAIRRLERQLTESQTVLWAAIIVASVFDVVTTITGLANGIEEGNAIARAFLATYGTPGIGMLKFVALVVVILTWYKLPDREASVALAGFAVVSLLTVFLNAITLLSL